jgi:F0F1-type ATP synthase assembly protein I
MKEQKSNPDSSWSAISLAWELGYSIAIPLVALALVGRFLDKKLGTSPWIFLAGILVAITLSSWLVYKKTKEIIER